MAYNLYDSKAYKFSAAVLKDCIKPIQHGKYRVPQLCKLPSMPVINIDMAAMKIHDGVFEIPEGHTAVILNGSGYDKNDNLRIQISSKSLKLLKLSNFNYVVIEVTDELSPDMQFVFEDCSLCRLEYAASIPPLNITSVTSDALHCLLLNLPRRILTADTATRYFPRITSIYCQKNGSQYLMETQRPYVMLTRFEIASYSGVIQGLADIGFFGGEVLYVDLNCVALPRKTLYAASLKIKLATNLKEIRIIARNAKKFEGNAFAPFLMHIQGAASFVSNALGVYVAFTDAFTPVEQITNYQLVRFRTRNSRNTYVALGDRERTTTRFVPHEDGGILLDVIVDAEKGSLI